MAVLSKITPCLRPTVAFCHILGLSLCVDAMFREHLLLYVDNRNVCSPVCQPFCFEVPVSLVFKDFGAVEVIANYIY